MKPVILIVLDGWGLGPDDDSNPIHAAKLTTYEQIKKDYPMTSLEASGINVGLPWGETGNSEVGHLTMGAGKPLYQHFPRIGLTIRDKSFFQNPVLKQAFAHARDNNSAVNFIGLLSKGNTHAALEHLQALLTMAQQENVSRIKLHLFADGKDSPPKSIESMLAQVPKEFLASLSGRYYGMDRESNWQLTQFAHQAITGEGGTLGADPISAIRANFATQPSEEYLPPLRFGEGKQLQDNDAVVFFNYREDSIRQIAESFIDPAFDKFPTKKFSNLFITTFTVYEEKFKVPAAFPADTVEFPLGRVISDAGKMQLRLAETYKYAHITYFFNGYREPPFKNEYRVLIPSASAIHPADHPEMMASAITDRLIESLEGQGFAFILANFANPDTIGHTGNYDASVKAAQIIDRELARIFKAAESSEAIIVLTADHGNIERVFNPGTGRPETQHDSSPVPFFLIAPQFKGRSFYNSQNVNVETAGTLADVAPTILELMELPKPQEMSGQSLLQSLL